MAMRATMRSVKNFSKGYTDVQAKVRSATSNDPWGPNSVELKRLSELSFDLNSLMEMMEIIDKRLNDKGKNWRHVYKSLILLEYMIHRGSENAINWTKDNFYIIKTLQEFQYIDDAGHDQGATIRMKAKELTSLLRDDERLRAQRHAYKNMDDSLLNQSDEIMLGQSSKPHTAPVRDGEDEELRRALEESKQEADRRNKELEIQAREEEELQKALKLSAEEEEMRRKNEKLAQDNTNAMYYIPLANTQLAMNPTGYGLQGTPVDFFGNPISTRQNQSTGFVQNLYANPVNMMPTGSFPQVQPQQITGYNLPTQIPPSQPLRPAQQPPQMEPFMERAQSQPLEPVKTGSNNPFAQFSSSELSKPITAPLIPSTTGQSVGRGISNDPRFSNVARHITGDGLPGVDTFGNTGESRIPQARTGTTFVNSAGIKLQSQPTGNHNPFFLPKMATNQNTVNLSQTNRPQNGSAYNPSYSQSESLIDI